MVTAYAHLEIHSEMNPIIMQNLIHFPKCTGRSTTTVHHLYTFVFIVAKFIFSSVLFFITNLHQQKHELLKNFEIFSHLSVY